MHLSLKSISILISTLGMLCLSVFVYAKEDQVIHLKRGFTIPLQLPENATTVALGDPNLVGINTLKPNFLMINGQDTGTTSLTVIGKSNSIYQYQLVVGNDVYQLRQLIGLVDKGVTVDDVNGVIVLRGKVASTAALTRVLSVADRFVGGNGRPNIKVISDKGGILAGRNTNQDTEFEPPLDRILNEQQTLNVNGGGQRGSRGLNRRLPIMDAKGNLGQNLQRADVISVANGKIISLIKVAKQPKVEMQLRIVAVDRNKTDEFGMDWRLDFNNVTLGSFLGGNVTTLPDPNATGAVNTGESNLMTFFPKVGKFSIQTFIRALEEKGASKTLSEPLLTAVSGESTGFLVGGSLPIPVQELSPGNATQNAVVSTNVVFIRYGLQLVVRPTVLENGKISIVLDQSISEPNFTNTYSILNVPIPSFTSKYVSTITESKSGETWAVAGLLTEEDTKNLKSIPWLSKIPMLGFLFQNKADKVSRNELMILVNARVVDDEKGETTTTSFDGVGNLDPNKNQDKSESVADKPSHSILSPEQQMTLPVLQNIPAPNHSGKKSQKNPSVMNSGQQQPRTNVQIVNPNNNRNTESLQHGVKIIKPASSPAKEKMQITPEDSILPNESLVNPDDTQPNVEFESKSKPQPKEEKAPNKTQELETQPKQQPEAIVNNQPIEETNTASNTRKINKSVSGKIVYYEDRVKPTLSKGPVTVMTTGMPTNPLQQTKNASKP